MAKKAAKVDDGGAAVAMSLRDYFAGQVMCGLIGHSELNDDGVFAFEPHKGKPTLEVISEASYFIADLMLAARKSGGAA